MAYTVIRPNGTVAAATYTTTGGAATLHAATSDGTVNNPTTATPAFAGNLDTTSIRGTSTAATTLDYGTFTLTAGQRIRRVRFLGRAAQIYAVTYGFFWEIGNTTDAAWSTQEATLLTTVANFNGNWLTTWPLGGGEIGQTEIDKVQTRLSSTVNTGGFGNLTVDLYEAAIHVEYLSAPTVSTVTASNTTTSRTPTIGWTATIGDSYAQKGYRIRVWNTAVNASPAWASTTGLVSDSGAQYGTATSAALTSALANGSYRAIVQVIKDFNDTDWYSASTAFADFTIAGTAPAPTEVAPLAGTTVTTDLPTLQARVATDGYTNTLKVKAEWQLATNSGFSTNLRTVTESDSDLDNGSLHSEVVSGAAELFQGTWWIRARAVNASGDAGTWSAGQSFTVAHAPSTTNVTPVGNAYNLITTGFTNTDTFTGSNSTTSIATATGLTWQQIVGTWGINTNAAYLVSASGGGNQIAVTQSAPDGYVQFVAGGTFTTSAFGLVFRYIDSSNYCYVVRNSTSNYNEVRKVVAGVDSLIGTTSASSAFLTGETVKVTYSGTSIQVFRAGSSIGTFVETDNATGQRAGLIAASAAGTGPRWDNFETNSTTYALTDVDWTFSDTSSTDYQTAYQVIVERVSTGASVADAGLISSTTTAATLAVPTAQADVNLRWKVRAADSDSVAGAYSTATAFRIGVAPTLTITAPSAGGTVNNPAPTFTWTFSAGGTRTQQTFRVVVKQGATTVYDSGSITSTATSHTPSSPVLVNSTSYTVTISAVDSGGLNVSTTQSFSSSWTAPSTPAMSLSSASFDSLGYVAVTWTTANGVDAEFSQWRVYRRLTGASSWTLLTTSTSGAASQTYNDYLASPGSSYDWAVVQVATRFGVQVESLYATATATPTATAYWLINPNDSTQNMRLDNVTSDDFTDEYEMGEILLIGRGRHVEYGTNWGNKGQIQVVIRDYSGTSARAQLIALNNLKSSRTGLYLRNPFGDVWKVAAGDIAISRMAGFGTNEYVTASIPYSEIV